LGLAVEEALAAPELEAWVVAAAGGVLPLAGGADDAGVEPAAVVAGALAIGVTEVTAETQVELVPVVMLIMALY